MRVALDTGPLISLSSTCLLWLLDKLPMDFYVPPAVVDESYRAPMHTKQYRFSAMRIHQYIVEGRLRREDLGKQGEALVEEFTRIANSAYVAHHRPLRIIHRGEAEAIILAKIMDNVLLVDERTIRLLLEDPEELKYLLERRTGAHIRHNRDMTERLQEIAGDVLMLRSADIVAYAYEEGILGPKNKEYIEAALYALKYAGCAISEQEIQEYVSKLGR
ncbi:MAG: hypothetical protein GXN93_05225 [Candidatus Diapherotrites archaeon]|nr:hypothetical protein [Candidatus Diapherotrites archaeon]